jgi:hypothetical protein
MKNRATHQVNIFVKRLVGAIIKAENIGPPKKTKKIRTMGPMGSSFLKVSEEG